MLTALSIMLGSVIDLRWAQLACFSFKEAPKQTCTQYLHAHVYTHTHVQTHTYLACVNVSSPAHGKIQIFFFTQHSIIMEHIFGTSP
jgi:hypothetical protein